MKKPKLNGHEVADILKTHGYEEYHYKGRHLVMRKNEKFVHVPMVKVLNWHIIKRIMAKTGIELIKLEVKP